jgi:DUF1009 family protein
MIAGTGRLPVRLSEAVERHCQEVIGAAAQG